MTDQTTESILGTFEADLRQSIDRRIREVCSSMHYHLTNTPERGEADIRQVVREILTMSHKERADFLRHVMDGPYDGPASLEGMEALESFIGNGLAIDASYSVGRITTRSYAKAEDWDDEDWNTEVGVPEGKVVADGFVLLPHGDFEKAATPKVILAAIAANRKMASRRGFR